MSQFFSRVFFFVLFVYLFYITRVEILGEIKHCLKGNGVKGLCKSINECQSLQNILKQSIQQDNYIISSLECPVGVGSPPFVCCTEISPHISTILNHNDRVIFPSDKIIFPTKTEAIRKFPQNIKTATNGIVKDGSIIPYPPYCGSVTLANKIFGGVEAELTEFSWMVNLEYQTTNGALVSVCSGSIINNYYIITAAHCIKGKIETKVGHIVSIRLGDHNIKTHIDCSNSSCIPPFERVGIESIVVHEQYGSDQHLRIHNHHDIALIRVDRVINFTDSIQPVCLPYIEVDNVPLQHGMKLVTAGWGHNGTVKQTDVKHKVTVPFVNRESCQSLYAKKHLIAEEQICAGGVYLQDSCTGDSGGPLMRLSNQSNAWILEGIVSYGHKCGLEYPGIYTHVDSYLQWIVKNLKN
ncbi:serine protease 7-like [Teleopsis dalmanni]|uniref:serine protease 7-like n=1 Tax=Teleopsis dalmanni TaxID=139649 RepID=UPI0018CFA78B|nr:serine protease 7-like [Teleopsis dalmanni]XP_037954181.1 serine protease 7-like [Teleopsis dalmanni]